MINSMIYFYYVIFQNCVLMNLMNCKSKSFNEFLIIIRAVFFDKLFTHNSIYL